MGSWSFFIIKFPCKTTHTKPEHCSLCHIELTCESFQDYYICGVEILFLGVHDKARTCMVGNPMKPSQVYPTIVAITLVTEVS